jgi:hypothetical protein
MYVLVFTCTIHLLLHQIQVRYLNYSRYQSIRPPLTMGQGELLLGVGVGMGEEEVRLRTSFLQKTAQVLVKLSQPLVTGQ